MSCTGHNLPGFAKDCKDMKDALLWGDVQIQRQPDLDDSLSPGYKTTNHNQEY